MSNTLDFKYNAERNAVAFGFLMIPKAGEYTFRARNHYDRIALYIDGKPAVPFHALWKPTTLTLPKGLVAIHIYAAPYTRGVNSVKWIPPGVAEFASFPNNLVFFDSTEKTPPLPARDQNADASAAAGK